MNMSDIILKKRQGGILNRDEIIFFVNGYTVGSIPDYQASALLMTFFFNPLTDDEIYNLTIAMRDSGEIVDLSAIDGVKVDKHSTGGVGDKTTIIVGPIVAAAGCKLAKMSGRGLGFTGGTIDKLESIPGFRTSLDEDAFIEQVNRIGISVIGQTGSIAPADKKIYALRDVTATVDSLGLIASSVMSKKLAAGAEVIVLDVKCGAGAFMENLDQAKKLASLMVDIGKRNGKKTAALITDMNQPLGNNVGNSLEVIESIEVLKGKGPDDIRELSLQLSSHIIYLSGEADSLESAYEIADKLLINGQALNKLRDMIRAQAGDMRVIEDYNIFPQASFQKDILAKECRGSEGKYISKIDADKIGLASQRAGAGREKKDDYIDLSAGIILHKKIGSIVDNEPILTIFGNDKDKISLASEIAKTSLAFSDNKPISNDLILQVQE